MTGFGERLRAVVAERGRLCVGIDPHETLLTQWGLEVSAAGAREFGLRVVDAAAGRVGIIKPQVSFFERYGSAGFAALEEVLASARAQGLLTIADAKRGDIGTTMDAYAAAWFTPGSALEADALTLSPYLGVGSLGSAIALAQHHDKGAFVLAATSNPEARSLQAADEQGRTVAAAVTSAVRDINAGQPEAWGSVGVVIGATVDLASLGLHADPEHVLPVLAPGFGAQGAQPHDLDRIFGSFAPAVVASESRSVLSAGPEGIAARITQRAELYRP